MFRNPRVWLYASCILMLLTAGLHSLSLFVSAPPANETERQMFDLITTYRMDLGEGFHPTFQNLFTALSSCFSLLYLFGGLLIAFMVRQKAPHDILNGVLAISLVVFGISFLMMAVFTFLPPIVCTGLVFVALMGSKISIGRQLRF